MQFESAIDRSTGNHVSGNIMPSHVQTLDSTKHESFYMTTRVWHRCPVWSARPPLDRWSRRKSMVACCDGVMHWRKLVRFDMYQNAAEALMNHLGLSLTSHTCPIIRVAPVCGIIPHASCDNAGVVSMSKVPRWTNGFVASLLQGVLASSCYVLAATCTM